MNLGETFCYKSAFINHGNQFCDKRASVKKICYLRFEQFNPMSLVCDSYHTKILAIIIIIAIIGVAIFVIVAAIFICVSSGERAGGRVQRPTKARLQLSTWSYLNNTHHDDYDDDDDDDDDSDDDDDDDSDDDDDDDDDYLLLIDFSAG